MYTLGVVSYLNALPLYRTLEAEKQVDVISVVPSGLAQLLEEGKCDVALMPIMDHFRGIGDGIVGDGCIGATGAVRSVRMHSNVPPKQIETVALDTSSHTSVMLLKVLLDGLYDLTPLFVDRRPDLDEMLRQCDAGLVIGDTALEIAESNRKSTFMLDLAEGWQKLTGLSFVFAAWIARKGLSQQQKTELATLLNEARDKGLQNLPQIVAQNTIPTAMTNQQIETYLRESIEFTMTDAHKAGMDEFRRRVAKYEIL